MYKSIMKWRFRHYLCFEASHDHFEEDRFDLHLLISRHKKFMRTLLILQRKDNTFYQKINWQIIFTGKHICLHLS